MVLLALILELILWRPMTCFILSLIIKCMRRKSSKSANTFQVRNLRRELIPSSSEKEIEFRITRADRFNPEPNEKFDHFTQSQDLEISKQYEESKEHHLVPEKKTSTTKLSKFAKPSNPSLEHERVAKNPDVILSPPKEIDSNLSNSNLKLLASIYSAFDPKDAVGVIKSFRKGGGLGTLPGPATEVPNGNMETEYEPHAVLETHGGLMAKSVISTERVHTEDLNDSRGLEEIQEEESPGLKERILPKLSNPQSQESRSSGHNVKDGMLPEIDNAALEQRKLKGLAFFDDQVKTKGRLLRSTL